MLYLSMKTHRLVPVLASPDANLIAPGPGMQLSYAQPGCSLSRSILSHRPWVGHPTG